MVSRFQKMSPLPTAKTKYPRADRRWIGARFS
jgi:hypothetical protein